MEKCCLLSTDTVKQINVKWYIKLESSFPKGRKFLQIKGHWL